MYENLQPNVAATEQRRRDDAISLMHQLVLTREVYRQVTTVTAVGILTSNLKEIWRRILSLDRKAQREHYADAIYDKSQMMIGS